MTDFLFARPSVLEGIGRNVDLFGVLNDYNSSPSGEEADKIAIESDWLAVYGDMHAAYNSTIWQLDSTGNAG